MLPQQIVLSNTAVSCMTNQSNCASRQWIAPNGRVNGRAHGGFHIITVLRTSYIERCNANSSNDLFMGQVRDLLFVKLEQLRSKYPQYVDPGRAASLLRPPGAGNVKRRADQVDRLACRIADRDFHVPLRYLLVSEHVRIIPHQRMRHVRSRSAVVASPSCCEAEKALQKRQDQIDSAARVRALVVNAGRRPGRAASAAVQKCCHCESLPTFRTSQPSAVAKSW